MPDLPARRLKSRRLVCDGHQQVMARIAHLCKQTLIPVGLAGTKYREGDVGSQMLVLVVAVVVGVGVGVVDVVVVVVNYCFVVAIHANLHYHSRLMRSYTDP
jgi:hypothetical protein